MVECNCECAHHLERVLLEVISSQHALQGYVSGNPITTEDRYDEDTKIDLAHGMGLISHELYEVIHTFIEKDIYLKTKKMNFYFKKQEKTPVS